MIEMFGTERLNNIIARFKSFIEDEMYPLETALMQLPFQQVEEILDEKRKKAKSQE